MYKFIKLHDLDGNEFYMNASKIITIERYTNTVTHIHIDLIDRRICTCKESPEEILKMI